MVFFMTHSVSLCLLFGLLSLFTRPLSAETAAAASVALFTAEPAAHTLVVTGFTRARAKLDLISEHNGRCLRMMADIGEAIDHKKQFACLDPTFIELELAANRVEQQRAKNDVQFYEQEAQRLRQLIRNTAAAQVELDRMNHQLAQARYQVNALQVQAERLQEQQARLCITAPAGWLVTQRFIEPQQWVSVGQKVGQVGDFSILQVPLALTAEALLALQQKQPLTVYLPELNQQIPAKIAHISPAFDPETRKINVELHLEEVSVKRGGWRVELTLVIPDPSGIVLVPTTALQTRYEEWFLLTPDGERRRVVRLGDGPVPGLVRVKGEGVQVGESFRVMATD